ncbi:MAG: cell division protein SepF [Clostridia bacterium]
MNERNFDPNDISRQEGAYDEIPRRYRSEANSGSKAPSRFGRIFGGDNNVNSAPSTSIPGQGFGNMQGTNSTVLFKPTTYDDVQMLIDHLKNHEQVIVDFSDINHESVYRILDFMSGAIYALGGSIKEITKNVFLFAPAGVAITVPPQLGRK